MRKLLLIGVGLVTVLVIGFVGLRMYTKSFSPEKVIEYKNGGVDLTVDYSQPSKKGRYIFGREQDNALLPYGKIWRTGANEATVIEFREAVLFAGKPIEAGKYSLWTIPGQGSWKVILNSEVGQWGTNYNDGKDVLKAEIPIRVRSSVQELFTIFFEPKPRGVSMILSWDQTEAIISIESR